MPRCRAALPLLLLALLPAAAQAQRLRLVQFTSDSTSYHVGSTLIAGPTEAILVDAQYHWSDARREADSIAALGVHLKAIVITHPDEDHYFGAAAFVEKFPGTPVYMTPRGAWIWRETSDYFLANARRGDSAQAPDSLVRPRPLHGDTLTVDGEPVIVIPDLQGDVLAPSNSAVWVPSLRALVAGDLVFNRVHPWLAASDTAVRRQWHASLRRLAALHPATVIAAHKASLDTPDTPDVLDAMDHYLTDFDATLRSESRPDSLVVVMRRKYPDWTVPTLLQYSAQVAFFLWGR